MSFFKKKKGGGEVKKNTSTKLEVVFKLFANTEQYQGMVKNQDLQKIEQKFPSNHFNHLNKQVINKNTVQFLGNFSRYSNYQLLTNGFSKGENSVTSSIPLRKQLCNTGAKVTYNILGIFNHHYNHHL